MYGLGSADNVKTTCNWRGQDEHVGARARSQVYMADTPRQDIWGAQEDLETAHGVVCSSARCKGLNFTC